MSGTMGGRRGTAGITRRGFLKTTACTAGALSAAGFLGSMTGCSPQAASDESEGAVPVAEDQVFSGVCRGCCAQGCFMNYHVREGKVVRTSVRDFVDPQYNRICIKGLSMPERVYSPDRVKYPMRRVGERGSGEWEQISWEEAIATITDSWRKNYEEHGALCCGFTTRTGQEGMVYTQSWSRLKKLFGGIDFTLPADKHFGKGLKDVIGSVGAGSANDDADWVNAKTMIFCGTSFTESTYQQWHWVYEAQKRGGKIIVIDPMFNGIASKADKYVPIRPGTDAALFMAMTNIAIANDWVDWDFLRTQTVAPGLVKNDDGMMLRMKDIGGKEDDETLVAIDADTGKPGKIDEVKNPALRGMHVVEGIEVTSPYDLLLEALAEYTPERASEICDVPVADMEEITELFCTNGPGMVKAGLGPDHRQYGSMPYIASGTFSIITGNLGKPGAGHGYYSRAMPYDSKKFNTPEGIEPLGKLVSMAPSQFVNIMNTGKYGEFDVPLKILISHGTDFIHTRGDRLATIEAIDKLDLLVSVNLTMNDTSLYSDIVLPVCEWCEYEEVNGARTYHPFLCYQDKVAEPQFESKSDFDIVKLLFEGMGHSDWFDMEASDLLATCYGDELYQKLKEEKCVYHQYFVDNGYKYIYGEDGNWGTTTGKAQFYIEKPGNGIKYESYGQKPNLDEQRVPYWRPPAEAWNEGVPGYEKNPLADRYPLSLQAEHKKWNTQTCFSRVGVIRELDPEPNVLMSAADAEARGIADGDLVRAYNDRGYVVLRAHVNNGLRPGIVNMPNGWIADQYVDGHYCDLLNDTQDPNNESCNFSDALLEIEKYEGEVSN